MSPLAKSLLSFHAWGGLILGWLLLPVFFAGSLAVFEAEISHWMQPELTARPSSAQQALQLAEARLRTVGQQAALWRIRLPDEREPTIGIAWGAPKKMAQENLDASSGSVLQPRASAGGHFFTRFHADFMLAKPGRWIIGAAGVFMLGALISGFLIHHHRFRDFFTLRPHGNRRRAWLDVHNLLGIATLPFLFMITYTGVVILAETFMPAATHVLYEGKPRAYRAEAMQQFERRPTGEQQTMRPLTEHWAEAEKRLGAGTVSSLVVRHPDDRNSLVFAYRHVKDRLAAVADHVVLDGVSGQLHGQQTAWNAMIYAYRTQVGLHVVRFGGPTLRWVYFVSGLFGCVLIATGLILIIRKREQKTGRSPRLLKAMSIAASSGFVLACLAYFWANRIIPDAFEARATWETGSLLAFWGASLIHALGRPDRAWREQLFFAALLAIFLPLLGRLTAVVDQNLIRQGVELTALALGSFLLLAATRLFPDAFSLPPTAKGAQP